jgi:hypothetical protein
MVTYVALLGGNIALEIREDLDLFHEVKEWSVEGVNKIDYSQKVNGGEGSHKNSERGLSSRRTKKCVRKKGFHVCLVLGDDVQMHRVVDLAYQSLVGQF